MNNKVFRGSKDNVDLKNVYIASYADGFRLPYEFEWNYLLSLIPKDEVYEEVEKYPNFFGLDDNRSNQIEYDKNNWPSLWVGSTAPNSCGIHDLLGNVREVVHSSWRQKEGGIQRRINK